MRRWVCCRRGCCIWRLARGAILGTGTRFVVLGGWGAIVCRGNVLLGGMIGLRRREVGRASAFSGLCIGGAGLISFIGGATISTGFAVSTIAGSIITGVGFGCSCFSVMTSGIGVGFTGSGTIGSIFIGGAGATGFTLFSTIGFGS